MVTEILVKEPGRSPVEGRRHWRDRYPLPFQGRNREFANSGWTRLVIMTPGVERCWGGGCALRNGSYLSTELDPCRDMMANSTASRYSVLLMTFSAAASTSFSTEIH